MLIALQGRQWATLGPDTPLEERLDATKMVVRLARDLGNKEVQYLAQFLLVIGLMERGDLRAADEAVMSAQQLAEDLRMPGFLPWVTAYRGMRASLAGRYEESDMLTAQALEQAIGLQLDPEVTMMIIGGQMVTQQVSRTRMPEMVAVLKTMADENPHHPVIRCTVALFGVREGQFEEARAAIDHLAKDDFASIPRDGNWLMSMWCLGVAAAALRDTARAAVLYERLLPFSDRWARSSTSISFGPVATALGMIATALKRFDEAESHLRSAMKATDEQQTVSLHMLAQREFAAMLYVRNGPGDNDAAVEVLDDVIERAKGLHTPVLEASAASLKARALARTPGGRKRKPSGR